MQVVFNHHQLLTCLQLLLLLLLLQVVPGTDLFNQMPSEVVLLVFKWLPKCTLAKSARGESAQIIKNL